MRFLFSKPAVPQEDILKQLIEYEVIILMDDSQSMEGDSWMKVQDPHIPFHRHGRLTIYISGEESYERGG